MFPTGHGRNQTSGIPASAGMTNNPREVPPVIPARAGMTIPTAPTGPPPTVIPAKAGIHKSRTVLRRIAQEFMDKESIIEIWRRRALTVAAACVLTGSMAMAADAGHPARHLVEQVTSEILEELTSQRESFQDDPQSLYDFVDRLIVPHFDFERMSRRVLGKRWKTASPEQQTRFVSVFRSLLVRTYSAVLNEYRGQTLAYLDPVARKRDDEIVIPAEIAQAGGQPIRIAYAMHQDGADWKIFDVAVEGVSIVRNYRSSFRSEIARHGIDGLITRLEAKFSTTN